MDQASPIDEIFELAERHLRILSEGLGRVEGPGPAQLFLSRPLEQSVGERPHRHCPAGLLGRVGIGEPLGVRIRPDSDVCVDLFNDILHKRRDVIKLGIAGIGVQKLLCLFQLNLQKRVSTALQNLVDRQPKSTARSRGHR